LSLRVLEAIFSVPSPFVILVKTGIQSRSLKFLNFKFLHFPAVWLREGKSNKQQTRLVLTAEFAVGVGRV
jgi:hypothetical protein